ncbi:DUF3365 domain-containing protein [Bacteroidota bacterium]
MTKHAILLGAILLAGFGFQCCQDKPVRVDKNVQYVTGADEVTYLRLGTQITDSVGARLKANLVKAIQESGPIEAVKFCNARAMRITNSYSRRYNTDVKRVSDRNRNESNSLNEIQTKVFSDYKEALKNGETLSAKIAIDKEGRKNFFAPIVTGGVCLTCHGAAADMQPELMSVIDSLYPNDKAKGYAENELRGIWSVKFKGS